MNAEPETKSTHPWRRLCRNGKIARLPQDVREELNQRLQDGESGRGLIKWSGPCCGSRRVGSDRGRRTRKRAK